MYEKIILFFVWFVRCFMWTLPFLCKVDYILAMDHERQRRVAVSKLGYYCYPDNKLVCVLIVAPTT